MFWFFSQNYCSCVIVIPFPSVVTCAQPSTIKNGKFTPLDSYEYEQTVTYSCNKGYKLQGASTIQCTEDGLFQPSPPQCEGKGLRKPQRYDYVGLYFAWSFLQLLNLLYNQRKGKLHHFSKDLQHNFTHCLNSLCPSMNLGDIFLLIG